MNASRFIPNLPLPRRITRSDTGLSVTIRLARRELRPDSFGVTFFSVRAIEPLLLFFSPLPA